MKVEVVTPKGVAVAGQADAVTAPGVVGEMGILPGHSPLITALKSGVLTVRSAGNDQVYAVGRGYAEIKGDDVVILVETAIPADSVDDAAARQALGEAEEALKAWKQPADGTPAQVTQADLQNRIDWAHAQLDSKKPH